jgi:peptidoglycan hydrolase-like protein with peptidoglycan-binding domain
VVVAPPALPESVAQVETYEVQPGSVGHVERLAIAATWQPVGIVHAARDGVLTSVRLTPGDVVAPGTTVATVDLEPVVVATGQVPMFRTLRDGVAGPDVRQLQELLVAGGYLSHAADGDFGPETTAATRAWQAAIGAPITGEVAPGSVVFVPSLPTRMRVVATVGDRLSPEADLAWLLEDAPRFHASIEAGRRGDLATGDAITIEAPDGSAWQGTLGEFVSQEGVGGYVVDVEGVDCGTACDSVPLAGETMLAASVVSVPETSGLVVPVSAMARQASGDQAVTLADGSLQPVTVVAEADGFAVVEGIEPGTRIQLPQSP